jgi:hypothetical protein
MKRKILYVGLEVHKKTTDVAIANGRSNGKVRSYGKIVSSLDALNKFIKKLEDGDKQLRFVYEAGPCGYQIYRHLGAKGKASDPYPGAGHVQVAYGAFGPAVDTASFLTATMTHGSIPFAGLGRDT